MKTIYVFSGLGADQRVFQNIDFSGFNVAHIHWVKPMKEEKIEDYAQKLITQIKTPFPILLGISFGGMIAIEVAKIIMTEKVILISSAKTQKEIPGYYRLAGQLKVHKILPLKLLKKSSLLTNWFFGIKSREHKLLFSKILKDTDLSFLKWAITKVLIWDNQEELNNKIHVHGTKDRILPIKFVKVDYAIHEGGHLMALTNGKEISDIIRSVL